MTRTRRLAQATFILLFLFALGSIALGDGVGAFRRAANRSGGIGTQLNVGTTSLAAASGDLSAGTSGAGQMYWDASIPSLTLYDGSGNAQVVWNLATDQLGHAATSGTPNNFEIVGQATTHGTNSGGQLALTGGAVSGGGTGGGGQTTLQGGATDGSGNGGSVLVQGGSSSSGTEGAVEIAGDTVTLSTYAGGPPSRTSRWVVEAGGDLVAQQTGDTIRAPGIQRRLYSDTGNVGNVGAGEDDLKTYTIAAGTLANDGDSVTFTGWGGLASNSGTREVKSYIGAMAWGAISGGSGQNGFAWSGTVTFVRISSTSIDVIATTSINNLVSHRIAGTQAVADLAANSLTVKFTGSDSNSNNDEVVQYAMTVDVVPAP